MAREWFIKDGESVVGPFGSSQLREMARKGLLTGTTPVRVGQDGEWVSAARVRGLFDPSAAPKQACASDLDRSSAGDVAKLRGDAAARVEASPPKTVASGPAARTLQIAIVCVTALVCVTGLAGIFVWQLTADGGEAERARRSDPTDAGASDKVIRTEDNPRPPKERFEPIADAGTAGGMIGLNSEQSKTMLTASTAVAKGMGLGDRGGLEIMVSAVSMMHGMGTAGIDMAPSRALAQAIDTLQVYLNTGSGMGFGNLLKAAKELPMDITADPEYAALLQGLKDGTKTQMDVSQFLLNQGLSVGHLSQYQGVYNAAIGAEYNATDFAEAARSSARRDVVGVVNSVARGAGANLGQIRAALTSLNDPRFTELAAATSDEELVRLAVGMSFDQRLQVRQALLGSNRDAAMAFGAAFNNIDIQHRTEGGSVLAIMLDDTEFRTSLRARVLLKNVLKDAMEDARNP